MTIVQTPFDSLRKTTIVFLILIFAAAAIWWVVSDSPWLPGFLLKRYLAANYPDVKVVSLTFKDRTINYPDQFSMDGIKLVLKRSSERLEIVCDRLEMFREAADWRGFSHMQIAMRNLQGKWQEWSWNLAESKIDVFMEGDKLSRWEGTVNFTEIHDGPYLLEDVKSAMQGNTKKASFPSVVAKAYGGNLKGQISLEFAPPLTYSTILDIEKVNLRRLGAIDSAKFSQMEGLLNGSISFSGDSSAIHDLAGNFNMPNGGKIKAEWIKPILIYIPGSEQRNLLENLIKTGGNLPVENVNVQLKSKNEDHLQTLVKLTSQKLNLDLNLTVDLNVEGGLKGLFDTGVLFSK